MKELLFIALGISGASLGFRLITEKGMVFYFMRFPFDRMKEKLSERSDARNKWLNYIKSREELIKNEKGDVPKKAIQEFREDIETATKILEQDRSVWIQNTIIYLAKPVILCSTCMASIHTLIWFPILSPGVHLWKVIFIALIVAFLNTLLHSLIDWLKRENN